MNLISAKNIKHILQPLCSEHPQTPVVASPHVVSPEIVDSCEWSPFPAVLVEVARRCDVPAVTAA